MYAVHDSSRNMSSACRAIRTLLRRIYVESLLHNDPGHVADDRHADNRWQSKCDAFQILRKEHPLLRKSLHLCSTKLCSYSMQPFEKNFRHVRSSGNFVTQVQFLFRLRSKHLHLKRFYFAYCRAFETLHCNFRFFKLMNTANFL